MAPPRKAEQHQQPAWAPLQPPTHRQPAWAPLQPPNQPVTYSAPSAPPSIVQDETRQTRRLAFPLIDRSGTDASDPLLAPAQDPSLDFPWLRRGAISVIVMLSVCTLGSLGLLVVLGSPFPAIVSPGLLAFTFGLRHGVDADHIAAIDNVTRKLLREGRPSLFVGLFFGLGHSTVVFVLCALIAMGSSYAARHASSLTDIGSFIGTAVSSTVLLVIGSVNFATAITILRRWRGGVSVVSAADHFDGRSAEHGHLIKVTTAMASEVGKAREVRVEGPGCLTKFRCCRELFRSVDRAWKLYPVGVLFGLGFDTASEVALLGLAAAAPRGGAAQRGDAVPPLVTMVLPLLFTCAMCLVDTLDGLLMLWAYGWATGVHPEKKLVFNLTLTSVSATIALFVGIVEALGLVQDKLGLRGSFWNSVATINDNFEWLGLGIVGFFALSLALALVYLRCCIPSLADRDRRSSTTKYGAL